MLKKLFLVMYFLWSFRQHILQVTCLRNSLVGTNVLIELGNNGDSLLVFLDLGMDDEGDDDPVPLPNVNAAILKKVR